MVDNITMPDAINPVIHEAQAPFDPDELRRISELFEHSLYGDRAWAHSDPRVVDRQYDKIEKSLRRGSRLFIASITNEMEEVGDSDNSSIGVLEFAGAAIYRVISRPLGLSLQHQLTEIAVSPGMRGNGIGSLLIRFVEHVAHEDGAKALTLIHPTETARPLYERLGYRTSATGRLHLRHQAMSKKLS